MILHSTNSAKVCAKFYASYEVSEGPYSIQRMFRQLKTLPQRTLQYVEDDISGSKELYLSRNLNYEWNSGLFYHYDADSEHKRAEIS